MHVNFLVGVVVIYYNQVCIQTFSSTKQKQGEDDFILQLNPFSSTKQKQGEDNFILQLNPATSGRSEIGGLWQGQFNYKMTKKKKKKKNITFHRFMYNVEIHKAVQRGTISMQGLPIPSTFFLFESLSPKTSSLVDMCQKSIHYKKYWVIFQNLSLYF